MWYEPMAQGQFFFNFFQAYAYKQALSRANSDMRLRKEEEWCNMLKITQEKAINLFECHWPE